MFAASKSGTVNSARDPYFPYVSLLLETTSTNGKQNNTFLDSSTNNFTITRAGTATQGSVTPYWPDGYWSTYFNGSTDYLSFPANSSLNNISTFCFEAWVNTGTDATNRYLYMSQVTGAVQIYLNTSNAIVVAVVGSGTLLTSTTTVPRNAWAHVAVILDSSYFYTYINGVAINSALFVFNLVNTATNYIGASSTGTLKFKGYISNLRVTPGVQYVAGVNFTPPTIPLISNGASLLTCQSNRIKDNSGNNIAITVFGTPKIQPSPPFSPASPYTAAAYGGSGYFNGSTDYFTVPSNSALTFGTSSFTFELWVYCTSTSASGSQFADASTNGFSLQLNSTNQVQLARAQVAVLLTSSTSVPLNQWTHIACVRNGTAVAIYINGVSSGTATLATNFSASITYLFRQTTASAYFPGYISNLRIVNGTAVYTAAFTPPTSPVTVITNTSLLLNFTNAGIYDATVQNNAITFGNAQASTTQFKWSPTSMSFDGTTGYLTFPSSTGFDQNLPFTIEAWLRGQGYWYAEVLSGFFALSHSANPIIDVSFIGVKITSSITISSPTTTWNHIAVTYDGTTTRLFVNGVSGGSSAGGGVASGATLSVARYLTGTNYYTGNIQDLRVTRGIARYITTFTPPTTPLPVE